MPCSGLPQHRQLLHPEPEGQKLRWVSGFGVALWDTSLIACLSSSRLAKRHHTASTGVPITSLQGLCSWPLLHTLMPHGTHTLTARRCLCGCKTADWALDADSIYRCTFSDILIESDRTPDREGHHGHHGICLVRAIDTLITDFVIAAPYVHDLTLAGGATGNVFRNGRTADLALDYHRQLPWSNLLTNVHAGEGNRPWDSGGEQSAVCRQESLHAWCISREKLIDCMYVMHKSSTANQPSYAKCEYML
jgi:hypothetical protein